MTYTIFEDAHYYICHDGRELRHIRAESEEQDGYTRTVSDEINERWEELRKNPTQISRVKKRQFRRESSLKKPVFSRSVSFLHVMG